MADNCCPRERPTASASLPSTAPRAQQEGVTHKVIGSCCSGGVPVFDGMDRRYKRVLWTVIAVNGAMFLTEMAAGELAGSQALKADALDFLGDTITYGLSLAVIGATLQTRAKAALLKGVSLSLMALWCWQPPSIRPSSLAFPALK